jgi:hypothetical protein
MRRFIQLIRAVMHRPKTPCDKHTGWRGRFGVTFITFAGETSSWWCDSPIGWIDRWRTAKRAVYIKAAYLYIRLTADRDAVVVSTHIKHNPKNGASHVKGNAKQ